MADFMYVAQRGSISTHGMRGDGIMSVVLIDCPGDERGRSAIWFEPDPAPDQPADQLDLTGTPGDESHLGDFLGGFTLCD